MTSLSCITDKDCESIINSENQNIKLLLSALKILNKKEIISWNKTNLSKIIYIFL